MGRHYSVEFHPRKTSIEKDILQGVSNSAIAKKYSNLTAEGVRHYKNERMPQILRHAQLETVEGLIGRINEYLDTVEDLRASIISILDDPENPGHICYYPKAEDIKVKYYNQESQRYSVAKLQDLLDEAEHKNESLFFKGVYVEGNDPRMVLLKTADVLNRHLELLSKAKGYITEENNITISTEASGTVEDIVDIARTALAPYPEASEAFINALLQAAEEGDKELERQQKETGA